MIARIDEFDAHVLAYHMNVIDMYRARRIALARVLR